MTKRKGTIEETIAASLSRLVEAAAATLALTLSSLNGISNSKTGDTKAKGKETKVARDTSNPAPDPKFRTFKEAANPGFKSGIRPRVALQNLHRRWILPHPNLASRRTPFGCPFTDRTRRR